MLSPTVRMGLLVAGAAASFTVLTACGSPDGDLGADAAPASQTPITSTTKIAGAGVLGNHRKPDESCATEPAPVSSPDAPRTVRNASGSGIPTSAEVRGDPQRIVALSPAELDALCALGLQDRVVGTTVPQPSYLGTVLHDAPGLGDRGAPDLAAVAGAAPELILGSVTQTPDSYAALAEIAPTVFTAGAADWQNTLRAVAAATGRAEAGEALLDGFERDAREAGARTDATHFQASVVQFTEDSMRVYGAENFPATVLRTVGADRPASQRFTDVPYIEVSITNLTEETDLSAADGDIVYLSFTTPAAKERATAVLNSPAWRKLSATRDDRVFAVNNEVWQTGQGVVAARGIIEDLRWLNAPIN